MKPLTKKQGTEQGKGKNKKWGKGVVLKRGRRSKKEEQEGKKSRVSSPGSSPVLLFSPTNQKLNAEFEELNESETRADKRGLWSLSEILPLLLPSYYDSDT